MASAYFLNAQPDQISITLNSGSAKALAGLNDPNTDPFCKLGIKPSPDKDFLGLGGVNRLVVRTSVGNTEWTIKLDVSTGFDIQFLVFANQVIGRQGIQTQGFTITQTASPKSVQTAAAKRRKRAPFKG